MPNPAWMEKGYDRVRGKEPLNALASQMAPFIPSLSGQRVPTDEPDPSYVPTGGPSLNVLGNKIMGIAEDPRNAWIGLGPIGMATKIPKAAKRFYHIIDNQTDQIVGRAPSLKHAIHKVDKLDNEYGAVRYHHKEVPEVEYIPD